MPTENKIDYPALHQRSDIYSFGDRVPRTVRMLKTVTADPMPGIGIAYVEGAAPVAKEGQTYPVWTNSHGAVTAVMQDGTRLGLRPAEFEVDSWHHPAAGPAPQHPEPIAWMVGTAFWWTKEEAERDAAATGLPMIPVGPLTGSAEVGQLREVIKHSDGQIMRQSMRISNQRTQLAARDALLRKCLMAVREQHCAEDEAEFDLPVPLMAEIDAALSASAEPSAPVELETSRLSG
ncbi:MULTISPECIES: hypothetical protein [Pseudomonas]|jgi:hypothetical protein|uniref:Uncharacterized protein n=1 Tax=Pseudomonas monteilii TaxID=76759 RepID=A0AAE6V392_9PSED|nr:MULTISPECIES: hypothetical protein [Pseudomonas]MBB3273378.1 hypothetical protein [Pseudomonas sp. OG7]QHB28177.1 hypothetical protein TCK1_2831 [Pseudomonas monteilii]